MKTNAIIYPAFALAGWTFVMAAVMFRSAVKAIGEGLNPRYFRYGEGFEPPDYMRSAYQHYTNLFEMPVLFYTAIVVTYVTGQTSGLLLVLAWAYVVLRVVHSVFHLKNTNVPRRRDSFLLSVAVLIAVWGVLLVRVATA